MAETAKRAFLASLIFIAVVAAALAVWKLKVLIALLFLAFIIAAAMRPSVEALHRRGMPRSAAILVHYAVLVGGMTLLLWVAVPRAIDQVRDALGGDVPTTRGELRTAAEETTGVKHDILVEIEERLEELPSVGELIDPAVEITFTAFEILVAIFFVLASAAYWIYERDKAVDLVTSLLPRPKRKLVRDTWTLIDLKLGAYVRGQALLIVLVATALSLSFWAIGVPLWLLLGVFAGFVELIPVIGPLAAGAAAVGVSLTESWEIALGAAIAVAVVRWVEDYLVIPRVLGDAVGLSPLLVLFSVSAVAILFGAAAVLLAIPVAAVIATLVEVIVLEKNPAEQDVPAVLFPAADAETVER
jgi:predicted PurR-regulated permease PerM